MPSEPTIADIVKAALESRLTDLFGPMPAVVVAFNPGTVAAAPSVDVQPVVQRALPSADDPDVLVSEPLPVVPNVPLVYLTAAGARITFPVAPGDTVLLVPLMLAITQWRLTGAPITTPTTDQALHHLGNCVAIPGLIADAMIAEGVDPLALVISSPAQINVESLAINVTAGATVNVTAPAVTIGDDGTLSVVVKATTDIKLGSDLATDPVANATAVDSELLAIKATLDSISPPPGTAYVPAGSVGFTKVKGE